MDLTLTHDINSQGQLSETGWESSHHSFWGLTYCSANKEESKVVNHIWVNNYPYSLSQNIFIVTYFLTSGTLFFRKPESATILQNVITKSGYRSFYMQTSCQTSIFENKTNDGDKCHSVFFFFFFFHRIMLWRIFKWSLDDTRDT